LSEHESDGEINLEEHYQRIHHVSKVKEATVCHTSNYYLICGFCE